MKISSDEKIIMQRIQGILLAESKTMSEIISEYKNQFGISLNPIVLERILKRTLIQEIGKEQLTQKFFLKQNKNEKKLIELKAFNDLYEAISLKKEYYKKFTFHELKNGSGRKLFKMCEERIKDSLIRCIDFLDRTDENEKKEILENLPEEIKHIFTSQYFDDSFQFENENKDLVSSSNKNDEKFDTQKMIESEKKENRVDLNLIIDLINNEKMRLGSLDANLLAENIIFRIKKEKWD